MFDIIKRKKFEINACELIDFLRILGRVGIQFKIGNEYVVEVSEGKSERYRTIMVFGTRKQIADVLNAQEIILEYCNH